jgi:hypothetical protein
LIEGTKGRDYSEELSVDGMDLKVTCWEDVDWIHLAQYRDQWRAFVKMGSMKNDKFVE